MAFCSVRWCGKSAKTSNYKNDGITFHRFPRCPVRRKQWIDKTYRGEDWVPANTSVICSRHFTEDSFHAMINRRRLLDSAVPTLYLPVLSPGPYTVHSSHKASVKNIDTPLDDTTSKKVSGSPAIVTSTKRKRRLFPILGSTSTYDTLVKKRLYRRIIKLTNVVKIKNKKIKKISDCNRRLKRQIHLLKYFVSELENKN